MAEKVRERSSTYTRPDFATFQSAILQNRCTDSSCSTFPVRNSTSSTEQILINVHNESNKSFDNALKNKNPVSNVPIKMPTFTAKFMANSNVDFSGQKPNRIQKPSGESKLASMARTVKEPLQEPELSVKITSEQESQKRSFLQVPARPQTPHSCTNGSTMKRSFLAVNNRELKSPSFLKKESKSTVDKNEHHIEDQIKSAKKPSEQTQGNQLFIPKVYPNTAKSVRQSQENSEGKRNFESFSNYGAKSQGQGLSPINSQMSSAKNKSTTNEPQESPQNRNLLGLGDQNMARHAKRKSSLFIPEQKSFFTPTEKTNTHNFISFDDDNKNRGDLTPGPSKNFTSKKSKFSQFAKNSIDSNEQSQNKKEESSNGQKQIPSFIKFKQKRNVLFSQNSKQKAQNHCQKNFKVEDFEIKDRLGKGAYGDVFLVRETATGFFCVLKKMSKKKIKEQKLQEQISREIKIQSSLNHKHLTSLYGFFDDEEYIYLIVEYLTDGSLAQRVSRKKCPEKEASSYMRQVCEGIKSMHIQDIIHRDLKLQNIFVHENYLKIGDFGCSVCSNSKRNTVVGSLAYFSPEQLNQESYDDKIDIWSLGVLSYELLTGRSPFEEDIIKIAKQEKDAKLSELRFPSRIELTEEAKDFTKRLLEVEPEKRMTISEALKHQFILKHASSGDTAVAMSF